MLLIAQCNALQTAMPSLFENIGDETELLLPDGLLHSGSLVRDWSTISTKPTGTRSRSSAGSTSSISQKKKTQVIGKVVKREDIPAATQLFTPPGSSSI